MKNKILVVDDSKVILIVIKKYFENKGYEVITTTSAIDGAMIIKEQVIPLVITDINMPEVSGLDFLLWIKKHSPETKVIVMTAFGSQETKKFVISQGGISYFEKSNDYTSLQGVVEKLSNDKDFESKIKEISLFDFVQLIIISGKDKYVKIKNKTNNKLGEIYFKSGKITHASYDEIQGEEALFQIMSIQNGEFSDSGWKDPEIVTINTPFEFLIMNIAQRIDEQKKSNPIVQESKKGIKSKDILIVDDESTTLKLLEAYLVSKNISVTTTESAIKAIQMMKNKDFGMVISDVNMPQIDGFQLMSWVKDNASHTKFMLMSGEINDSHDIFSSRHGVDYIEKPINLKQLENHIDSVLTGNYFSGNVQDINIFDFIQIIAMSRKNKVINLEDKLMQRNGKVFIKEGNVIHAEFDNLTGESAFLELAKIQGLVFNDSDWQEPKEITIKSPLSSLLIKTFNNMITEDKEVSNDSEGGNKISADLTYLEKVLEERERLKNLDINNNIINEEGEFAGVIIGKSTKEDIINSFTKYNIFYNMMKSSEINLIYDDVGILSNITENGVVEEITFNLPFKGSTKKGLKLGDKLDKAVDIYGKPEFINDNCAVWTKMSVFADGNRNINTITIGAI